MNYKRLTLIVLFLSLFIAFIIGCTESKQKYEEIIFYAEGENWNAQYKTNSVQASKDKVVLDFLYKGSLSELSISKKIVFSYGTVNGSITKTLSNDKMDTTHFLVEFDRDLINGDGDLVNIVENRDEEIMSIINWNEQTEKLHLNQYIRK